MECYKCKRNINNPTKAESKYRVCSFCGKKSFPNKHEVKIGMKVEIKVSNGYNKGRAVQGKLEEIETNGDWHYEGLMVVLDNGDRGRLKKIVLEDNSQNDRNSNLKINENKKDNSAIDNQIAIKEKQIRYAEDEIKRYEKLGIKNSSSKISKENKSQYKFYQTSLERDKRELEKLQNQSGLQNKQTSTCDGKCKKFKVKKPAGESRYGSGQAHCQMCDIWIDHKGCHMKDGTSAQEGSVGWFCNCCNYRVRQIPRNKKYKDKFRAKNTDYQDDEELIQPEDLHISKGQARLLKNLVKYLPDFGENVKSGNELEQISESDRYQIEDNWVSIDNFLKLATNYFELNKISAIILFEKLHEKLEHVPKKEEFFYNFPINEDWVENEFQSWENFLELLNYDPWYRDKKIQKNKLNSGTKSIEISEKLSESKNEISESSIEKIREELEVYFKELDSKQNYSDYSHLEMFQLFENYLKIIPEKWRYSEIRNLF